MTKCPLVIHDDFLSPGGGENVAMVLCRSFNARLWTGHLDDTAFPEGYFRDITYSSLQAYDTAPFGLKFSKIAQMWYAFSRFPASNPPWTIFSGSLSILAHRKISGTKILYCHTPPRLLYDQMEFYLKHTFFLKRPALLSVMYFYKKIYEDAVQEMDVIIANSKNIQKRVKKYLSRDSVLVYPPCDTIGFKWIGQDDYYLSTARPDLLKRVDLIVKAFLEMPDKKLVVVSGGSELERIRNMAHNAVNIKILGWVDNKLLTQLTGRCIATIYIPRDEDFGISPVESMAAGKPVIGVAEGGLLETVRDGETGILINSCPSYEDVIRAVKYMTSQRANEMRRACEQRALRFQTKIFVEKIKTILEPEQN